MNPNPNIIVILGPTASGKTRLAVRLARERGGEVISADSRQVYRGMDLGTGKDRGDFQIDDVTIPCHLLDLVAPGEDFHLFAYQRHFYRTFRELTSRGVLPILAGGSGLYLEAVVCGYVLREVPEDEVRRRELEDLDMPALTARLRAVQPALHNKTDLEDRARLIRAIEIAEFSRKDGEHRDAEELPVLRPLVAGVRWDRDVLRRRITERLQARLQAGMVEEVQRLHDEGIAWERLRWFGLEYRYLGEYLQGQTDYETMFQTLNTRIHQFAKRQETWFRRMERRGVAIHWLAGDDYDALQKLVDRHLSR